VIKDYKRLLDLLVSYSKLNKPLIMAYIFLMIVDSVAQIVFAISAIPLVDLLSNNTSSDSQSIIVIIKNIFFTIGIEYNILNSIFFFIISAIFTSITETLFYFIGRKNVYSISGYLTSKGLSIYFSKGLKFINSQNFGKTQNTLQKEIEKITNGVDSVLIAISSFVQVFLLLFLAFSLSSLMTLITVVGIFIFFFFLSGLNGLLKKLSDITVKSGNELSHALFEPLLNAKQVLSSGRSKTVFANYLSIFNIHSIDAVKSQTLAFFIPLVYRLVGIISTLVALYVAILYGHNPAILVAALFALIRITPVVSKISSALATINVSVPSLNQFENMFGSFVKTSKRQFKEKYNGFSESIILDNVGYCHSSDRGFVYDINLKIEKNSYVSFIGSSGSGKTTTVDILLGLLNPNYGSVLIDKRPLKDLELNSFLKRVGYVQQDSFLFNGTIMDNLLWSNPSATEMKMWDALKIANIDDFIFNSSDQLNLLVGDGGVSLSGGQKQRIALAQAIVRDPDILILDEATSSLDQESERLIVEALKKIAHKITIISITHRPSMAKYSDVVYFFDKGRIIEFGRYKDLTISKKILYR